MVQKWFVSHSEHTSLALAVFVMEKGAHSAVVAESAAALHWALAGSCGN